MTRRMSALRRSCLLAGLCLLVTQLPDVSAAHVRPGATQQVDLGPKGEQPRLLPLPNSTTPAKNFYPSSLSGGGRFVAFASYATNLVGDDTNLIQDVFVRDRTQRTTKRVSVTSGGGQAVGPPGDTLPLGFTGSTRPQITPNGRFVAFESDAVNLVANDRNLAADIFVRDRTNGTTERVSVATGRREAEGISRMPSISANGRFVAFQSTASNLVAGDTNASMDAFVHDRSSGKTIRVSVQPDGSQFPVMPFDPAPSISPDGSSVAFTAYRASHQAARGFSDVFVYDMKSRTSELVSGGPDGSKGLVGLAETNIHTAASAMSSNGRFVVFHGNKDDLIPNDTTGLLAHDIFVFDRKTRKTERVSVASDGSQAASDWERPPGSGFASISANGRYVAFMSEAIGMSPGYSNSFADTDACRLPPTVAGCHPYRIFVHDRTTGETDMVSRSPAGQDVRPPFPECRNEAKDLKPHSWAPYISPDGRFLSFSGCGLNPAERKALDNADPLLDKFDSAHVYVRDRGPEHGVGMLSARDGAEGTNAALGEGLLGVDRLDVEPLGGDILAARVVHRPDSGDLFFSLDVGRLSEVTKVPVVYGFRFRTSKGLFQVAATPLPTASAATFSLAHCHPEGCSPIADLGGGFGTAGETITAAVPLADLPTGPKGLRDVIAFSRLAGGAATTIDELRVPGVLP